MVEISGWEKKIDEATQLLSEAIGMMNRDELNEFGYTAVNPAYESLLDVLLKREIARRENIIPFIIHFPSEDD